MIRLLHLADLHFGRSSGPALEFVERFVAEHRSSIDLVIVTGDWTQRGRAWQFCRAREFIQRIASPVVSVPGNHDLPLFDLVSRFFSPLAGYRKHLEPITLRNFRLGESAGVCGISTVNPWVVAEGRVTEGEIAVASNFFSTLPPKGLRILGTHHPLYHAGAGEWMAGHEAALALAPDILLAGHAHRSAVELIQVGRRRILSVVAGTACSDRLRGEENGFHLLEIDRRRVRVVSYSLGPDGFIAGGDEATWMEL